MTWQVAGLGPSEFTVDNIVDDALAVHIAQVFDLLDFGDFGGFDEAPVSAPPPPSAGGMLSADMFGAPEAPPASSDDFGGFDAPAAPAAGKAGTLSN